VVYPNVIERSNQLRVLLESC